MRLPRWTPVAVAVGLALTAGGVAVAAGQDRPEHTTGTAGSGVVNVEGHEVDEHAAFGQETAAQARAQGDDADDQADDETDDDADEQTDEQTDDQADGETDGTEHGKSGQPHGHAGEHGQGHAWAFGHLSPEARKAAIAEMQASHHDARPEQSQAHGPQGR